MPVNLLLSNTNDSQETVQLIYVSGLYISWWKKCINVLQVSELHPNAQMVLLVSYTIKRMESLYLALQNSSTCSYLSQEIHLWIFFCPYTRWCVKGRRNKDTKALSDKTLCNVFPCELHTLYHPEGLSGHWPSPHWRRPYTEQGCQLIGICCNWHDPPGRHIWMSLTGLLPLPIKLWAGMSPLTTTDIGDGTRVALWKDIYHRTKSLCLLFS